MNNQLRRMMKPYHILFMMIFAFYNTFFALNKICEEVSGCQDTKDQALDVAKKGWDGASQFWQGVKQSFGFVDSAYVYSFRVWNDSPAPVYVAAQSITGILGAQFAGDIKRDMVIGPSFDTGTYFNNQHLYIGVWLCADKNNVDYSSYKNMVEKATEIGAGIGAGVGMGIASPLTAALGAGLGALVGGEVTTHALEKYSILEKNIPLGVKNDPNIYHYRAYTHQGDIKAEYLGINTTTDQFSGMFYNSTSDNNIFLEFAKDEQQYKVTLEAGTFSLLNSTTTVPNSIRPPANKIRAFTFYQDSSVIGAIPIGSEGIMSMVYDDKSKNLVPGAPLVYTYQIYRNKNGQVNLGMQGLAIGNHDQPLDLQDSTKSVTRDINPTESHIWIQSAQQAQKITDNQMIKKDYSSVPFDSTDIIWLTYKTKDYVLQKKLDIGSVLNFNLIRPTLSEKEAWLYIVSLNTKDDSKAIQFLNRLSDGTIGKDARVSTITQFDPKTELGQLLPNTNGVVADTQQGGSGITGIVLLTDVLTPYGVSIGPFYYTIPPAQLRIDQLAQGIINYLDPTLFTAPTSGTVQDAMMQDLASLFPQWISGYATNKQNAITQVTSYLQTKGVGGLFTNPQASGSGRILNDTGKLILNSIITGPVSLANPPLLRQAGTNWYVFGLGEKPTDWL